MVGSRRAMVFTEVLCAAAVVAVAGTLLLVAGDRQRKAMGIEGSMANLRQLSAAHASYGSDNAGRIATLGWTPTSFGTTAFADLGGPYTDDLDAGAAQAVDIMRRLSGSTAAQMPRITGWIPHVGYSHLALVEYLGAQSPAPFIVSPGDAPRLKWRKDYASPNPSDPLSYRLVQSSSYEFPTAFWCNDFGNGAIPTVTQSTGQNFYQTTGLLSNVLGKRRYDATVYPSSKVMLFEQYQWFFGNRAAFALYPEARVPALLCDGSVRVRATSESNLGGQQSQPQAQAPTFINYSPLAWDPPALYPSGGNTVAGCFRWTRYGLRGRDFDGPETTTPP